ncbi:MAG: MATE family efflux transporter, partial [Sutterella sp.]|nr:MATE family efflux transporter [Sutterella sp.]
MSENLSFTKPDISYRAIARLAAPILVANISIIGSGTIDTIMAGRLGAEHLAAVAIGNATVIMVILTLVGVIQSLSPLAGHHFGARRFERIGFELT